MKNSILRFRDIWREHEGVVAFGRLKITPMSIEFKNKDTGVPSRLPSLEIKSVHWQRLGALYGLRIQQRDGGLLRFGGFRNDNAEERRLRDFFKEHYRLELETKSFSLTGRAWGTMDIDASSLSFALDDAPPFEIPITCLTRCSVKEDGIALKIRSERKATGISIELRGYKPEAPRSEVKAEEVADEDDSIAAAGLLVAEFAKVECLTPHGRFDIRIFTTFIELRGAVVSFGIGASSIQEMCLLPLDNGRQMYFVLSLNGPIELDPTGGSNSLVLLFNKGDEGHVCLSLSGSDLRKRYDGKLGEEMSGRIFKTFGRILKAVSGSKILKPRGYISLGGTSSIPCQYRSCEGSLYVLRNSFVFVSRTAVHIHFEEIASVNLPGLESTSRSSNFEIHLLNGTIHVFILDDRNEIDRLNEFVQSKAIQVNPIDFLLRPQDESGASRSSETASPAPPVSDRGRESEESDGEDKENITPEEINIARQMTRAGSTNGSTETGSDHERCERGHSVP